MKFEPRDDLRSLVLKVGPRDIFDIPRSIIKAQGKPLTPFFLRYSEFQARIFVHVYILLTSLLSRMLSNLSCSLHNP